MAQIFQIPNGQTLSPIMPLEYDGAVVQIRFFDGAGEPVAVTGLGKVYQRFGPAELQVQRFAKQEWRFNGPCDQVRIDLADVTGFVSYRVFIWRAVRSLPVADPRLMTGTTKPRLRVDMAQTGFFEGREFRTFREFSIASGATLVVKVVVPINAILFEQGLELDAGALRITNATGGTAGGVFGEVLPVIGKNNMTAAERPTPFYAPQIVFTAGGTHVGGFVFDVHRVVTSSATAQQFTVGSGPSDERGIAPGTYYVRYENISNGDATGTFRFIWEERP